MRRLWKYSLAAACGLLAATAQAADLQWRPVGGSQTAPASQVNSGDSTSPAAPGLFPLIAPDPATGPVLPLPASAQRAPAVSLGQPVPAASLGQPMPSSTFPMTPLPLPRLELLPAAYTVTTTSSYNTPPPLIVSASTAEPPLVRVQPGEPIPQPMPVGPPVESDQARPLPTDRTQQNKTPVPSTGAEQLQVAPTIETIGPTIETIGPSVTFDGGVVMDTGCGVNGCTTCGDTGCTTCGDTGCMTCGDAGCMTCGSGNCGCNGCCDWDCVPYQDHRFYVGAEYLLWFMKSDTTPPLVTTSNATDLGVIGRPSTSVLYGGPIDSNPQSGGRVYAGYWLDDQQCLGIEGRFFFFPETSNNFSAQSNSAGSPVLMRPFVLTGAQSTNGALLPDMESSEQVAVPGEFAGKVSASLSSQLWGAEANLRANLLKCCCYRVDLLGGFRFLNLDEKLGVGEDFTTLPGDTADPVGSRFVLSDMFKTSNQFYGGQLGVAGELHWQRFVLDGRATMALGWTHQAITIGGSEQDFNPAGTLTNSFNTGLLAQRTNSGQFSRDMFSVVPEVGLNVGYQVTDYLTAYVGYSFLYWTNVARPGEQVDRTINISQLSGGTLAGPTRPVYTQRASDFWAQGVNFGLVFRY